MDKAQELLHPVQIRNGRQSIGQFQRAGSQAGSATSGFSQGLAAAEKGKTGSLGVRGVLACNCPLASFCLAWAVFDLGRASIFCLIDNRQPIESRVFVAALLLAAAPHASRTRLRPEILMRLMAIGTTIGPYRGCQCPSD